MHLIALARLFAAQLPFDPPEVKSHTRPKDHGYIVRKLDGQRVVDAATARQDLVNMVRNDASNALVSIGIPAGVRK